MNSEPVVRSRDSMAVTSLVFGGLSALALLVFPVLLFLENTVPGSSASNLILPLICIEAVCSFVAIVAARVSLDEIKQYPHIRGKVMARFGLILGIMGGLVPAGAVVVFSCLWIAFTFGNVPI